MAKVKVLVQQSGLGIRYWAVTETGCKPFGNLKDILTSSYDTLRDIFVGYYTEEQLEERLSCNIVGELLVECNLEEV